MASRTSAVVIRSIITSAWGDEAAELPCRANAGPPTKKAEKAKATQIRVNFTAGLLRSEEMI
jgi:hypothetical protein